MHAGARCFYRLEDWWTYELCYQKHVRQFHREKDVLTAEYLLGVYHQDSADIDTLQVASPNLPLMWIQICTICTFRCTMMLSLKYLHICLDSVVKQLSLSVSSSHTVYTLLLSSQVLAQQPHHCSGQLFSGARAPDIGHTKGSVCRVGQTVLTAAGM